MNPDRTQVRKLENDLGTWVVIPYGIFAASWVPFGGMVFASGRLWWLSAVLYVLVMLGFVVAIGRFCVLAVRLTRVLNRSKRRAGGA